ncbi:MFS transporter [Paenibacillus sp.]|uniref:MFS transporter n=1 Tax=Paenibacillus sp. TaxID=58172 RepID=UPI002811D2C1|nr:MFS transporter [Paenibacillus sp.]
MEVLDKMLGLRPEDRRKVWLMGSVFFLAGVAELLNYTSFMALFNGRFGTQYLPVMYIVEAFLLPLEGWALAWVSQRMSKPRFMTLMYASFIALCFANGALLIGMRATGAEWLAFYPFLFITSNFVVRQQTLLMWSTAFDLCPTQQAKRVMPVFVSMAILGGVAAGVLSRVLAPSLGAEAVYFLGPVVLALGFVNFRKSLKRYLVPLTIKEAAADESNEAAPSAFSYVRDTLRSPFLLTAIGIMTLMPALYFLMEYQYFTSAQAVFADEHELTSFYGLMVILLFCAAFLLQLVSSKLMDKLGASNMLIAISAIFLLGFAIVVAFVDSTLALPAVSIGYSLTYLLLYYFAEPSHQLFFKMLPLHKRDGIRFMAQSIAASAGILIGSGLSMLHSEGGVGMLGQAALGAGLSVLLLGMSWAARGLYVKELVRSLEVGVAFARDALTELLGSLSAGRLAKSLTDHLHHPNEAVREVAIELLRHNPDPARTEELLRCAETSSPRVRVAALKAVHPSGWLSLSPDRRLQFLRDSDAEVRAVAFRTLLTTNAPAGEKRDWVRMARGDASPAVLAEALLATIEVGAAAETDERAAADLRRMLDEGGESAVSAMSVIGERRLREFFYDVLMRLGDPRPSVKTAAVRTLGKLGGEEAARELIEAMIGADTETRAAVADALANIGDAAVPVLAKALQSPHWNVWQTAVSVLSLGRGDKEVRHLLVPSCVERLAELREVRRYGAMIAELGSEEWTSLAAMRTDEIRSVALDAVWSVMVRFGDERAVPQIRKAIEDPEEEVRDNGMEILSEGLGDARLSAALLAFYRYDQTMRVAAEPGESSGAPPVVTDAWLQAIAVKAKAEEGEAAFMSRWEYLSALDKMVFLKQVPLFENISLEELGRVAGIANEKTYEDGEFLVKQGEPSVSLIVIVEGHVELSGRDAAGKEGTVGVFGPKQSFGEGALFDDRPSLVSAQALFEPVRVLEIEGGEMSKLVRLYPDIGVGLLRAAGHRIRTLEQLVLKLG